MSTTNPYTATFEDLPARKRRTILTGFENYARWADETHTQIRKEALWKYIEPGVDKPTPAVPGTAAAARNTIERAIALYDKETAVIEEVIKTAISDDVYKNVEGIQDPAEIWRELKRICSQAGQGVVLTTLTQLHTLPTNSKTQGTELSIATRCGQAAALIRRLEGAVTNTKELFDAMKVAVVLQGLPTDYDHMVTNISGAGNKTFAEVQQMLGTEEQHLRADREVGVKPDLAMKFANAQRGRARNTTNLICYTCSKPGHVQRDCWHNPESDNFRASTTPGKRRSSTTGTQSNKRTRPIRGKVSKSTSKTEDSEDSEREKDSAKLTRAYNDSIEAEPRASDSKWYIDSCCTRHLTNDRSVLESITSQQVLFETAKQGGSMQANEIGVATLLLQSGVTLRLPGVAYVPEATDSLISIGRLRDSGVTYHDVEKGMLLKQYGRPITTARREGNLFAVHAARPEKAQKARGRPTYLQGTSALEHLWHRRFGHASHVRVAKAAKMLLGISLNSNSMERVSPKQPVVVEKASATVEQALPGELEPEQDSNVTLTPLPQHLCEPCVVSKQTKIVRHIRMRPTTRKLERVHADLWGPHYPSSLKGSVYAADLIDDYTRKSWVLFLKTKDSFYGVFVPWLERTEIEAGSKLQFLRSDGGGEFVSKELIRYCESRGVTIEPSTPYIHEENGVAERTWRTLDTTKNAMLEDSNLPNRFWAEAMDTTNYLRNKLPTLSRALIPDEAWYGAKQNVSHLRIFGSYTYIHIPKERQRKSDTRKTWAGILIGYDKSEKIYRVYNPIAQEVTRVSSVTIDEARRGAELLNEYPLAPPPLDERTAKDQVGAPRKRGRPKKLPADSPIDVVLSEHTNVEGIRQDSIELEATPDHTTMAGQADSLITEKPASSRRLLFLKAPKPPQGVEVARRANEDQKRKRDVSVASNELSSSDEVSKEINIPKSYKEATADPLNGKRWRQATIEELDTHAEQATWRLETLPEGRKTIDSKWVFTAKWDNKLSEVHFKARLVARGFGQEHGLDYGETFAPTVAREAFRILLAIVGLLGWPMHQMDVKSAFLEGWLDEEVFMRLPEGLKVREGAGNIVCRLVRSLYGLKQSARVWNQRLSSYLLTKNYRPTNTDPSIFIRTDTRGTVILAVHVDDFGIAGSSMAAINGAKADLNREFRMKDLGEISLITGWTITRDSAQRVLTIDQSAYIVDLLIEYGLQDCKASKTPMQKGSTIGLLSEDNGEDVDIDAYGRLFGQLNWLAVGTRPDISFAVGKLGQHLSNPKKAHLRASKRILRYLRGTVNLKLTFKKSQDLDIKGYFDADYANDPDTRKSVSGHCFLINGTAVHWSSKKQRTVSKSTTEAEYISGGSATQEAIWIRRFINEIYGQEQISSIQLWGDNQKSLGLANKTQSQNRTKHIDVQHHFVQGIIERGEVSMSWVPTDSMLADGFTKALPIPTFERHREMLGLV